MTIAADTAAPAQPVLIEADRMELDQLKGTSHYQGSVLMQQGDLQIKAESITLHRNKKAIERLVAKGSPAILDMAGEAVQGPLHAEAQHMEYLPQSAMVHLQGNAQLWRNGSEFHSEQISVDLRQQLVRAKGNEQGSGRVRILLQPEENQAVEPRP